MNTSSQISLADLEAALPTSSKADRMSIASINSDEREQMFMKISGIKLTTRAEAQAYDQNLLDKNPSLAAKKNLKVADFFKSKQNKQQIDQRCELEVNQNSENVHENLRQSAPVVNSRKRKAGDVIGVDSLSMI